MGIDEAGGGAGAAGTEARGGDAARGGPQKGPRGRASDGIRQGIGVLSALKDALEETIREARERGDLSPDRAKDAVRSAMAKAQQAAGEARERFDFVPRAEHDRLREQVEALRARVEDLERRTARAPDARVEGR